VTDVRDTLGADAERRLRRGEGGAAVARAISNAVEERVQSAFGKARRKKGIAVLAIGGLARHELAPRADIDLLVLIDDRRDTNERAAERALYPLWDAGFVLGHAVRTPDEAMSAAREDQHAATALLEARLVAGDEALGAEVLRRFRTEVLPQRRQALIEAKLGERAVARERFGESVYAVEPNVKSSPGGLRDLHAALWVGLLRAGAGDPERDGLARLLQVGFIYEREARTLREARDVVLKLRAALHIVTERAEDRLLFGHQEAIAALLGVEGSEDQTVTEALMGTWFRAALLTRRTVDDVLARLVPSVGAHTRGAAAVEDLEGGFKQTGGKLFLTPGDAIDRAPRRMIDAARIAAERDLVLAPRTRSRLYQAAADYDGKLWDDRACGAALLRLCRSESVRRRPFGQLLEAGVLSTVLRDIRRLEGRFKQDGYHAYTTDAHICQCTDMALRVASGEEPIPPPLQAAAERTTRFHLVVLGALFHDIGKGLGGEHSELGAEIAEREARRLGLPPDERAVLRFLVTDHLILSHASQRRDITDPAVIEELASRAKTRERLDLLALLTWVDIAQVAPGMFTDWKARLLGVATERVRAYLLSPEASASVRGEHEAEVRQRAMEALEGEALDDLVQRFVAGASVRALATRTDEDLRGDLRAFAAWDGETPVVRWDETEGGQAHFVRVVCRDRRGLLADLAAALSSEGANVLFAHAGVRDDGVGFDVFAVDDGNGQPLSTTSLQLTVEALQAAAVGGVDRAPPRFRARRRSAPRVPPRARVVPNADTFGSTVFELRAADHPGLVAALARTFERCAWSIDLAKISTDGANVNDTFYASPEEGAAELETLRTALLECLGESK